MIILVQNLGHPFFCVKGGFYFGVVDIDSEVVDNLQKTTMWTVQIALENGVYSIDELVAHIQVMLRQ
jgi:hypothetical protein